MPPEEKELLEKSVKLAEDNNKILHSMRRSMRLSRIMTFLYWIAIVGSAVGAYYFIQPYVEQLTDVYGGAKNNFNGLSEVFQGLKQER